MENEIHRINRLNIIPSAAFGISKRNAMFYTKVKKPPEHGDVVYGEIVRIGQHQSIESKTGRIHRVYTGDMNIFVFGNRYAPDYYEALIPEKYQENVDLVARSGVISQMVNKNGRVKDPTTIKIHGFVCNADGELLNTTNYPKVTTKSTVKKPNRAKLIVFVGTSMNSGKSFAAAATVKALTRLGHNVRASKITGTASLKDIMNMEDSGAEIVADFTYFGHPSTYMLSQEKVMDIFNKLDIKYANRTSNFWIVEIADGILQRETAMLLANKEFRDRTHRLVFCAGDALGAVGGERLLKDKFGIKADMISGLCTATPLHIQELQQFIDTPILVSANPSLQQIKEILA